MADLRGKPKPKPKPEAKHGRKSGPTKPSSPQPIANLLVSQGTLPSTGGSITLTYSSSNASACSLSSSPSLWSGRKPVDCSATMQVQVPANAAGGSWVFTFTAVAAAGKTATAAQTVVERSRPTATLTLNPTTLTSSGGSITLGYSASNASSCSLASSPQLWATGGNPATVNCGGSYEATLPAADAVRQWTFTFTATNDQGETATATQALIQQAPVPQYGSTSSNWSGYALLSSVLLTEVGAKFQVPHVNCAGATSRVGVSEWVGIGGDGAGTGDLLQTGVRSNCVSGVQQNVAWWELVPGTYETDFDSFTIYPGDTIQASVFLTSGGAWATRVDDLTTGVAGEMLTDSGWGVAPDSTNDFSVQGSTLGVSYLGGYSADWILEDYSESDGSLVDFANYGTVDFENPTTSLSSWSLTPSDGIALVESSGTVVSAPYLRTDGGFTVGYTG